MRSQQQAILSIDVGATVIRAFHYQVKTQPVTAGVRSRSLIFGQVWGSAQMITQFGLRTSIQYCLQVTSGVSWGTPLE
jgi:hypothetical protein